MENASIGEEPMVKTYFSDQRQVSSALATSEQALRKGICSNPGMALAISAAIGVVIACLIKRR
jgi:ElaB/YqjD/DUF883 family membrane-anchored ribosome-binding protein